MKHRGRPPKAIESRFAQWLRQTGRTRSGFARELGEQPDPIHVTGGTIAKIAYGYPPNPTLGRAIVSLSAGLVTFDDLYRGARSESAA